MSPNVIASWLALVLVLPANAQFGKIFEGINNHGETSDTKTASGLKESPQIGTDHAVDLTGTTNGTLNRLFYILGQEQNKIRTNPAAQITLAGGSGFPGKRLADERKRYEYHDISSQLVAKNILPACVYSKIKDKIIPRE